MDTVMFNIDAVANAIKAFGKQNGSNVSIILSYEDKSKMHNIRAYHVVKLNAYWNTIINDEAKQLLIASIEETYNHGETSEEEIKSLVLQKFLVKILELSTKGKLLI